MSTEAELLERFFGAINRNDMLAVAELFDPEIVRIEPERYPTAGTYRGVQVDDSPMASCCATARSSNTTCSAKGRRP